MIYESVVAKFQKKKTVERCDFLLQLIEIGDYRTSMRFIFIILVMQSIFYYNVYENFPFNLIIFYI